MRLDRPRIERYVGGRKGIAGWELYVSSLARFITMTEHKYDWFGDTAENFVAYCFAREGFEVFGSGRWTADLMVRDPAAEKHKWWKVEVKSTVRPGKWPHHGGFEKLSKNAELFAEVRLVDEKTLEFRMRRLTRGGWKKKPTPINQEGDIREFLQLDFAPKGRAVFQ